MPHGATGEGYIDVTLWPNVRVFTARQPMTGIEPVALPQSAVSDLLEVRRTGEGVDLIRASVRAPTSSDPVIAMSEALVAQVPGDL
jgi:hypothetical protein